MFFRPLAILTGLSTLGTAKLHVHDGSFVPDQILRVTAQNITQGCLSRYSVLVNGEMLMGVSGYTQILTRCIGTFPGPELRFQEGQTRWIRVYNDMGDKNLTMVSIFMCSFASRPTHHGHKHWHGLSMAAYPFSDGTPQASQASIDTFPAILT